MIPFRADVAQHALQLLVVEGAGVTVITIFQRHGATFQQGLTAHAIGKRRAQFGQHTVDGGGNLLERREAQRLLVDGVTAEELIGTLAGQHHLHVLARFSCHEVQRDQGRIRHGIIEVPDDLGHGRGIFLGADHLDNVLGTNGRRGFRCHVHLGVTLALKAGGERQQIRIVALGQGGDSGGVDASGEEAAHCHISAHVLSHRIFQRLGDLLEHLVLIARGHLAHGEARLKPTLLLELSARLHGGKTAGFHATNSLVQALRLRHVLQIRVVRQGAYVQLSADFQRVGHGKNALLFRRKHRASSTRGVVHGLDTELIAREEQLFLLGIPDAEGEHSAQVLHDFLTPVVEANHDGLAVALSIKGVASGLQFFTQFHIVVDLAIERQGIAFRLIRWAPL